MMHVSIAEQKALSPQRPGFDMRRFNPQMIAYYETEGWRAYYARNWLRAFGLMVCLSESQFHIPFPRSFLAVYHIIRASAAFVPRDHDLRVVSRHLEAFYRIAAEPSRGAFDPRAVADLELRYWVIHRELAETPDADKRPLIECLAALHGALFGRAPAEMWDSAVSRVAAADAVDRITSCRSADPSADWELVESSLRRAYSQVKQAAGE
jgi:hypothetical protein